MKKIHPSSWRSFCDQWYQLISQFTDQSAALKKVEDGQQYVLTYVPQSGNLSQTLQQSIVATMTSPTLSAATAYQIRTITTQRPQLVSLL